jgi:hypothetical protein
MQLERREAIELAIVIQSLVAIGSSGEAFELVPVTGSESKTNEVEKSYKRSGALNQKHRGRKCCGERKTTSCTRNRISI